MERKSATMRIKATDESAAGDVGEFEAIVSVFGNVDTYGERVVKGAFADTLKEWEGRGDPIPVLWSHQSGNPKAHIGTVLDAAERDDGLWVKAALDLDADPLESDARQVWRLLKGRRVTQFSFAYDVLDWAEVGEGKERVLELRKLNLYEVGPTLIGVNQDTELLAVKGNPAELRRTVAALKAGRSISKEREAKLRTALDDAVSVADTIREVLSVLDDDGKAKLPPGTSAEALTGNALEPHGGPAMNRLRMQTQLLALTGEL
jgi:HK97 family phage prohead protease